MGAGPGGKQPNMNQLFKEEWEALQVIQHSDILEKIESELVLSDTRLRLPETQLKKAN